MMAGKDKNNRKRKKYGFIAVAILLFIGKIMMNNLMASLSR